MADAGLFRARLCSQEILANREDLAEIKVGLQSAAPHEDLELIVGDTNRLRAPLGQDDEAKDLATRILTYHRKVGCRYQQGLHEVLSVLMLLPHPTPLQEDELYVGFETFVNKFVPRLQAIQDLCKLFRLLVLFHDPVLMRTLDKAEVIPDIFCFSWFFTAFSASIQDVATVQQIWAAILREADELFCVFFALAWLLKNSSAVVTADCPVRELPFLVMKLLQFEADSTSDESSSSPTKLTPKVLQELQEVAASLRRRTPRTFLRQLYTCVLSRGAETSTKSKTGTSPDPHNLDDIEIDDEVEGDGDDNSKSGVKSVVAGLEQDVLRLGENYTADEFASDILASEQRHCLCVEPQDVMSETAAVSDQQSDLFRLLDCRGDSFSTRYDCLPAAAIVDCSTDTGVSEAVATALERQEKNACIWVLYHQADTVTDNMVKMLQTLQDNGVFGVCVLKGGHTSFTRFMEVIGHDAAGNNLNLLKNVGGFFSDFGSRLVSTVKEAPPSVWSAFAAAQDLSRPVVRSSSRPSWLGVGLPSSSSAGQEQKAVADVQQSQTSDVSALRSQEDDLEDIPIASSPEEIFERDTHPPESPDSISFTPTVDRSHAASSATFSTGFNGLPSGNCTAEAVFGDGVYIPTLPSPKKMSSCQSSITNVEHTREGSRLNVGQILIFNFCRFAILASRIVKCSLRLDCRRDLAVLGESRSEVGEEESLMFGKGPLSAALVFE